MWQWLDRIPVLALVVGATLLGLAPFTPEPHLWEKLRMLADGVLVRPIDIFDLIMHVSLPVLFVIRLARMMFTGNKETPPA